MTTSGQSQSPDRSLLRIFGPAATSLLAASGLGFVYWIIAAHLYSPGEVGRSGATIALVSGIGVVSSGGLYSVLIRALAAHRNPRRFHLLTCVGVVGLAGTIGLILGILHVGRNFTSSEWLWLPVLSAVWALYTLQDAILISLRKTTTLFVSNVGFGVEKLVLLVVLSGSSLGILLSWAIPLMVVVPVIAIVADRTIAGLVRREIDAFVVTASHVIAEYVSAVAAATINSAVPVIVSMIAGGSFAGVVYVCWMLYISADSLGTILSSVVVSNATERRLSASRSIELSRSANVVISGLLLVGIILAPVVLKIFGATYAQAGNLLRLLLLAVLIRVAGNLALAGLRINRRFRRLAIAQVMAALVTSTGVAIAALHHSEIGIGCSVVFGAITLVGVAMTRDVALAMVPWGANGTSV